MYNNGIVNSQIAANAITFIITKLS